MELKEEIPTLREKIDSELRPVQGPGQSPPPPRTQEIEQGINLLKGWADSAETKMGGAAAQLGERRDRPPADQQSAIQELEQIWEAIVPFQPCWPAIWRNRPGLPERWHGRTRPVRARSRLREISRMSRTKIENPIRRPKFQQPRPPRSRIAAERCSAPDWTELQAAARRRTQLLQLKAQAELDRLEQAPPDRDDPPGIQDRRTFAMNRSPPGSLRPHRWIPRRPGQGFAKRSSSAPQAVAQMDRALDQLQRKQRTLAYPPAEEARRLLQEIQDAQPKQTGAAAAGSKNQNDEQKDTAADEQKPDNQSSQDEKQPDERTGGQETRSDSREEAGREQPPSHHQRTGNPNREPQPQTSPDRVEEALRKVRDARTRSGTATAN